MSRTHLRGLLVCTSALFIVGCARNEGSSVADSAATALTPDTTSSSAMTLQGGEWLVDEIDGAAVFVGSSVTISFGADGRVGGRACNSYGGQYEVSGDSLKIAKTMSTKMACSPAEVMEQEAKFLGVLENVTRFEIPTDGRLVLHTADGRAVTAHR